ncbi:ATP-binding protein [Sphingomonas naphthae]|uniref:histidine kinase n=1 Tax=Sphingomonas naphthae TaxID=1813468 RepID=A0ABY7TNM2_9SPHN|nr:ATP-binding protein [Sphingomonas naphthae]WCT74836.1 ATP-binding protein [Sphingomonas naphthae]
MRHPVVILLLAVIAVAASLRIAGLWGLALVLGSGGGAWIGWRIGLRRYRLPDRGLSADAQGARPDHKLIEALDEPTLILDGARIFASNAAARELLGAKIDGALTRLAIRHPAATTVLTGDSTGPVELAGLGDPDRRWEMAISPIDTRFRLLRLQDRSYSHAAEKMRTHFVANASHELRTPLATLIGFIETLEDDSTAADRALRQRFLGIMAGEARRMRQLIDDLLSLSRIEADRYVVPAEPVDLSAILAQVVGELRTAGEARDRISTDVNEAVPAVTGDSAQLSQLLYNLIGNALKYGRSDGAVRVTLAPNANGLMLSVADEGDGIPAQHLPRLTERFYRVDQHRSRAKGGTGLGLAIVKHIVERHRGRLEIASIVGVGTTVTVTLPAAQNGNGH